MVCRCRLLMFQWPQLNFLVRLDSLPLQSLFQPGALYYFYLYVYILRMYTLQLIRVVSFLLFLLRRFEILGFLSYYSLLLEQSTQLTNYYRQGQEEILIAAWRVFFFNVRSPMPLPNKINPRMTK